MAAPTRFAPPVIKIVLLAKFNFYSLWFQNIIMAYGLITYS
jgi:hypothetical protein